MASWGRAGAAYPETMPPGPRRYGVWSLVLALATVVVTIAFLIVATTMNENASDAASDIAFGAFLFEFLLVAPVLHIAGVVFGLIGLARRTDPVRSVLGIVLNIVFIGMGAVLTWIGMSGAAAFT